MIKLQLMVILFLFSTVGSAKIIIVEGKIKKTLAANSHNQCMILLDKAIGSGCRGSWVSLDCKGQVYSGGKWRFTSALSAATAGRSVSVHVNSNRKVGDYCIAGRIDVNF